MRNCSHISQTLLCLASPNSIGKIGNFTTQSAGVPGLPLLVSLCYCVTLVIYRVSLGSPKSHDKTDYQTIEEA